VILAFRHGMSVHRCDARYRSAGLEVAGSSEAAFSRRSFRPEAFAPPAVSEASPGSEPHWRLRQHRPPARQGLSSAADAQHPPLQARFQQSPCSKWPSADARVNPVRQPCRSERPQI